MRRAQAAGAEGETAEVQLLSPQSELAFVSGWYELASASHFWMVGRLAAVLRQCRAHGIPLAAPLRLLEIGCGEGVLRAQLEGHSAWTIDGCDLDLASLRHNPRGRGEVFLYDIFQRLPALEARYDGLLLFDVIEHIADVPAFLEAALFHLKPGGWVFLNVPALQSLYSRYDEVVGHQRRYDKRLMTDELQRAGLTVVALTYWGLSFLPLLLLRQQLLKGAATEQVVAQGFRPPSALANALLTWLIRAEVALLGHPVRGTSLLAIGRKA